MPQLRPFLGLALNDPPSARRVRGGLRALAVLLLGGCRGEPEGAKFIPAAVDEPARRVEAGPAADGPARTDRAPAVRRIEMH